MNINSFLARFRDIRCFSPEDETGGGGGDGDTAPGGDGTDTIAAGGDDTIAGAGDPKWWEGKAFSQSQRDQLTALGLTVDDPLEAVARLTDMEAAAKRKLGKPAAQLMDRPKEGQELTEWMRQNGEIFGIPESAEAYEIKRPDDWPKDAKWDETLEASARAKGHELGLNGAQMQAMVDLYAGAVTGLMSGAEQDLQQANQQLQAELQRDWGDQYGAKVAQAQQAASVLAEAAGLDSDALMNIAQSLKGQIGDANSLRLFAAVGQMMGEDTMPRLQGGNPGLGTTPADARAELAAMKAEGSEYQKAFTLKRQGKPSPDFKRLEARREQLLKIVGQ